MTANTKASRKHVAVLTPPSPEPGKSCRSIVCYGRHTESCRDKASRDEHTRKVTIVNDNNRKSEELDLQPHRQILKWTGSQEIRQTHASTWPLLALEDRTGKNLF